MNIYDIIAISNWNMTILAQLSIESSSVQFHNQEPWDVGSGCHASNIATYWKHQIPFYQEGDEGLIYTNGLYTDDHILCVSGTSFLSGR